uniref:LAGLIDADG homing endonuclease n=1 Tax=Panagrolaimus sp. PS1159 TaxID=55785 RepID=A0AC35GEP9_9BILA
MKEYFCTVCLSDPTTYKHNPAKIINNYKEIVHSLCHNRKTVYYGNIAQMSGIWYAKPDCFIRTLDKIGNESIETFLTIGYRKNLPKKTRERIDEFFHLLFSVDAFNRHWARIYQSYYTENNSVMF